MRFIKLSLIFIEFSLFFFIGQTVDVDENHLYPLHWELAASSIQDFSLIVENVSFSYRSIDPWSYIDRLGIYKILIEITTPFMPFCSSSNASNILFALPSQFGWLFESNRLFSNGSMNISSNSWWASANYYLAVIPFLVADEFHLIKNESFRFVQRQDFCVDLFQCENQLAKPVESWRRFFHEILNWKKCLGKRKLDQRTVDLCFLAPMWSALKSTIESSLPLVSSKLKYLPSKTEQDFGLSWARLINLAALTRKNTNLYETINNQRRFLPFRLLKDEDRPPTENDLPTPVKRSLELLFSFRFDWLSFIETIWKRITCNYEARLEAQSSLDMMAVSKLIASNYLAKAAVNSFLYNCDRFWSFGSSFGRRFFHVFQSVHVSFQDSSRTQLVKYKSSSEKRMFVARKFLQLFSLTIWLRKQKEKLLFQMFLLFIFPSNWILSRIRCFSFVLIKCRLKKTIYWFLLKVFVRCGPSVSKASRINIFCSLSRDFGNWTSNWMIKSPNFSGFDINGIPMFGKRFSKPGLDKEKQNNRAR